MIKKIILFGAGEYGRKAVLELQEKYDIICFIDNSQEKYGIEFEGIIVQPPQQLPSLEYDKIVISSQFYREIIPQLLSLSIPRNKIAIYDIDFPHSPEPRPETPQPQVPAYKDIMSALLGEELSDIKNWESVPAEKAAFTSLLRSIKPECAIEIGTYLGASLRVIHHFSEKIYSLDIDPSCKASLEQELPKAEFIIGPSQKTLPVLLEKIALDSAHPKVEFVFVDGDHSREGVAGDLQSLLKFKPKKRMVILMHDAANPECRKGMINVDWANNPYVHYVNIDFVPGILHYQNTVYREMWGGFAIALMLPHKRKEKLTIQTVLSQQYDALYRNSNHAYREENPFKNSFQPFSPQTNTTIHFTACLPNYNHGNIIENAVNAMLSQTRPPDELLICDDASTDDSWTKLQLLQKKHPTIRLIKNKENLGVVKTLAHLLKEARGDYVYFAGADDEVMPLFFENVLHLLEVNPDSSIGMASFYSTDETGKIISHNNIKRWTRPGYYSPEKCLRDYFLVESPSHSLSSGTIYKREALINIGGFRTELGHWTDSFAIRVLCLQSGCIYTPHPGAKFYCSESSYSGIQHRQLETSLAIIKRVTELMTSSKFYHLFPQDYVIWWQKEFQKLALSLSSQSKR